MIQLTQKGKEIYGDRKMVIQGNYDLEKKIVYRLEVYAHAGGIDENDNPILKVIDFETIASNPIELKALLDMGLIEIK